EEMDLKVLQFKNKKLAERLEQRQAIEDELRERIEKLEKRQATDDATLLIVNRYWTQLDENVQVLLHRYDSQPEEPPDGPKQEAEIRDPTDPGEIQECEGEPEPDKDPTPLPSFTGEELNEPALSFLATLASSSSEEIELQLQDRMAFSKNAVARIVEVFDKLHRRIEDLCQKLNSEVEFNGLEDCTKCLNKDVMGENRRLQDLTTQLQGKHHKMSMEYNELQDKVQSAETKVSEMETTIEDLQWDIEKLRKREQKLNKHLAEALEQLNSGYHVSGGPAGFQGGQITLHIHKVNSRTFHPLSPPSPPLPNLLGQG
ncbi:E3 ubiquitin-protein ligase BRE1B-like, partial [Cetorhinus maximus]